MSYLFIKTNRGSLPAKFRVYGRNYEEAFENMIQGYNFVLQDFREGLPEERSITLGICEQESKLSRDTDGNEITTIIGKLMALKR